MHRFSLAIAGVSLLLMAADWTRFRGPAAQGTSDDAGAPASWTATENVVWKTALPGFGASSPITCGNRIFLTCYSGYGLDEGSPGEQESLEHHLVCVNRADGEILWQRTTKPRLPEQKYDGNFIRLHGYASGTPTTDGQNVYAFFGRSGVFAYNMDGEPLWQAQVGDDVHEWGSGTSPILCGNVVIVNASVESKSVVGLDKATGNEVWQVQGIPDSWSTPLVVDVPGGTKELVVSMKNKVLGLNPATGEKLWECVGIKDYVCPAVIAHEGVVYIAGGRRPPQTLAIRAGGRGDVTDTHLLWVTSPSSTKVPTPLYHQGRLHWINEKGIATCMDAKTGDVIYEERLEIQGDDDKVYASLVLADGKLFGVTRQDGTVVLAAGPELKELGRNHLGDSSVFNATPVASDGQLLIRSDQALYCIGG
ncbi:MAG: outer membrane protein assembly factor BamB family protein [Planctomycetota bacterium]